MQDSLVISANFRRNSPDLMYCRSNVNNDKNGGIMVLYRKYNTFQRNVNNRLPLLSFIMLWINPLILVKKAFIHRKQKLRIFLFTADSNR